MNWFQFYKEVPQSGPMLFSFAQGPDGDRSTKGTRGRAEKLISQIEEENHKIRRANNQLVEQLRNYDEKERQLFKTIQILKSKRSFLLANVKQQNQSSLSMMLGQGNELGSNRWASNQKISVQTLSSFKYFKSMNTENSYICEGSQSDDHSFDSYIKIVQNMNFD